MALCRKMKSPKPILVLLLVFVTGIAVGVVGTRYFVRKTFQQAARDGGFFRDRMERELITQLDLSPEQHEEVRKIFARNWEEFRKIRVEFHPRFTNIAARTEADIKAVLTPEQRTEFEQLLKDKKAMWRPPTGRLERPPEWHDRKGPSEAHREAPGKSNESEFKYPDAKP